MNLGVLASHEGTTLQSLLDAFAFAGGRIPGRVSVVVSNNGDSGTLVKARQAGVQAVHCPREHTGITYGDFRRTAAVSTLASVAYSVQERRKRRSNKETDDAGYGVRESH